MVISIGEILQSWDNIGIFAYVLPFLLIFAMVYGILASTSILGKNNRISTIIAIVVGLLALQSEVVPAFFAEIFPRLATGLSIFFSIMILVGLFIIEEEQRYWYWGLGAIAGIIALVVISNSFGELGLGYADSYLTGFSSDFVGYVIGAVLLIGIIIAVAASTNTSSDKEAGKAKVKSLRSD